MFNNAELKPDVNTIESAVKCEKLPIVETNTTLDSSNASFVCEDSCNNSIQQSKQIVLEISINPAQDTHSICASVTEAVAETIEVTTLPEDVKDIIKVVETPNRSGTDVVFIMEDIKPHKNTNCTFYKKIINVFKRIFK